MSATKDAVTTGPSERRSDGRLADEAARWRKSLRAEEDRHAVTRAALAEANRLLVSLALRGRLLDPSLFELIVGVKTIEDSSGRIVWSRLDLLLGELLRTKPYLAAPTPTVDEQPGIVVGDRNAPDQGSAFQVTEPRGQRATGHRPARHVESTGAPS